MNERLRVYSTGEIFLVIFDEDEEVILAVSPPAKQIKNKNQFREEAFESASAKSGFLIDFS